MEDLWRTSYPLPYEQSSSSQTADRCISHYQIRTPIKSIKYGEPGTCTDTYSSAAKVFDGFVPKSLFGRASSGPVVQLDRTAGDDSSPAVARKFVTNVEDEAQTLNCNSRAKSLLNSHNSLLRPTRNNGWKKASGGGGHDHLAGRVCTENGHVHKLVERQRRKTMKTLCLSLTSLLPEEYHKKKLALSDQLLEAIKYIHRLQDTLIKLEKKRDELSLSGTAKSFSKSSCVYKSLQASQVRPPNAKETFPAIRVNNFGSGIQVIADTFQNQIDFSSLLMVLEEAGVEVVSATVSAINDRCFYSIHSKFSEFLHFDRAVLDGRIEQLVKGNFPSNSLIK